jgi:hypothetical protein
VAKYVKAEPGSTNTVIYTDDGGKQSDHSGGTRTWRNNNPGNLVVGNISRDNGAIGKAGGFAVFPDYEAGHAGLIDCLKRTYGNADLEFLVTKYAPPDENETLKYLKFLRNKTGIKNNKKVRDFTIEEFEKLWMAIEQMEGWKVGKITDYNSGSPIKAVKKNKKGIITHYLIEGYGWVAKRDAIQLVLSGKVAAVVAVSTKGNQFLRAKPNSLIDDNLENLG